MASDPATTPAARLRETADSAVQLPPWLEGAGDLAVAALAAVVLEWRVALPWAIAFGVPATLAAVASGVEGAPFTLRPGWFLPAYLLDVVKDGLAGGLAVSFFLARQQGMRWRWDPGTLVPALCLSALLHLGSLALDVAASLAGLAAPLLRPVLPLARDLAVAAAGGWAAPAFVFVLRDRNAARAAVDRALSPGWPAAAERMAAGLVLGVLAFALELVARVPEGMAASLACSGTSLPLGLCGPWPRFLWLWALLLTRAAWYALAVLAAPVRPDR